MSREQKLQINQLQKIQDETLVLSPYQLLSL